MVSLVVDGTAHDISAARSRPSITIGMRIWMRLSRWSRSMMTVAPHNYSDDKAWEKCGHEDDTCFVSLGHD